ncbi:MAG: hypothetical protein MK074_05685 [Phycisphaerales bacterium]|nr:hypothetical protein [Phycisphaerales bacterium]
MSGRVLLIGARASGKSTVAAQLGAPWIDMDDAVCAHLGGSSAGTMFSEQGEAAWRDAEATVLRTLLDDGPSIIAAGGGVGCVGGTCDIVDAARAHGTLICIWLRITPETAMARLAAGGDRPALRGEDAVAEAPQVMADRSDRWQAMADHIVDADGPLGDVLTAVRAIIDQQK